MTTHRRPGKLLTRNGGLPDFRNNKQGILAFFRPFLRRGIDVTEFHSDSWRDELRDRRYLGTHVNDAYSSCTLTMGDDIVGNVEIGAGAFGIRITVTPRNGKGQYTKCWKRTWRKFGRTQKSQRRPKFRKFGAYAASELMKQYKDYAVTATMES
jgi:hypothetical protein